MACCLLENYTFPHEARFQDPAYARSVADFFFDELQQRRDPPERPSPLHPVNAASEAAQARGLRFITGKVLQDRNSPPDGVRDETEQSLIDTEALIQRWHGVDRLGYAITPRFAPPARPRSCAAQGRWPRNTAMCGFKPMWRKTAMKCAVSRAVPRGLQLFGGLQRCGPAA